MSIYIKLFNLILQSGKMPDIWCQGLITPIYKTGNKSDPTNYRGICVSSCLGKLFCCILNQRLYLYFKENKILHNSQTGVLPENRTTDHVFTLRTLIDKYVHYHKEKVYACFVNSRKAFDSVWHEGLVLQAAQNQHRRTFQQSDQKPLLQFYMFHKNRRKENSIFLILKRCTSRMYFKSPFI